MHASWKSRGAAALFALFSTLTATAQTLRIDPNSTLQAGQTVTLAYSNPNLAGQQVTIEISGGFPVVTTETVVITLDSDGRGTGSWTANSAWYSAGFNAPGVAEVTRLIRH